MSSSAGALLRAPTGCGAKSDVSAGTSECGAKPLLYCWRTALTAATVGAVVGAAQELDGLGDDLDGLALGVVLPFHSRQSRRPSMQTGRPLVRKRAQFSPWAPQTVTLK